MSCSRLVTPLLATAALTASIAAQTPPCESRNDANTNVSNAVTGTPFVGRNPVSHGYEFTPATALGVQAAAIFTGSPGRDDFMRLELWSDDPTNNEPMARLAVGTMASPMTANAHWLGANFDTTVILQAGTKYWFVWIEAGQSVVPEEPGGVMLQRMRRQASNAWGSRSMGAIKFRLFCNLLDEQGVSNFGSSCANSSGQLATVFTNEAPMAGNAAFAVEGTNLPPAAPVFLAFGVDPNHVSTPLGPLFPPGCMQNTDILLAISGTTGQNEIGDQPPSPRPPPFGHVRFDLPLTSVAAGSFIAMQMYGLDSGFNVVVPLVGTQALRIQTF